MGFNSGFKGLIITAYMFYITFCLFSHEKSLTPGYSSSYPGFASKSSEYDHLRGCRI